MIEGHVMQFAILMHVMWSMSQCHSEIEKLSTFLPRKIYFQNYIDETSLRTLPIDTDR